MAVAAILADLTLSSNATGPGALFERGVVRNAGDLMTNEMPPSGS